MINKKPKKMELEAIEKMKAAAEKKEAKMRARIALIEQPKLQERIELYEKDKSKAEADAEEAKAKAEEAAAALNAANAKRDEKAAEAASKAKADAEEANAKAKARAAKAEDDIKRMNVYALVDTEAEYKASCDADRTARNAARSAYGALHRSRAKIRCSAEVAVLAKTLGFPASHQAACRLV